MGLLVGLLAGEAGMEGLGGRVEALEIRLSERSRASEGVCLADLGPRALSRERESRWI